MSSPLVPLITIFLSILCTQTIQQPQTQPPPSQNWNFKFSFTKNINSQMCIECENSDQIWIGWSHYGTRNSNSNSNPTNPADTSSNNQFLNFPNENDCWMNFTEKIAEQCNGAAQCELSSQPTYIHKCGKISDYLYVAYKCIKEIDTFDICNPSKRVFKMQEMQSTGFYIKSSEFPVEYSSSLDCSCLISSNKQQNLKLEVLWFSLQDNDYLNIFNKNLSGWINPAYEMPISSKVNTVRFLTDDSLAYKGFWLKISSRKACKDDWQLVGDSCVKVFNEPLDWRSANQRCLQMNGNLIKIDDVVSDLKLTQYIKSFYPEINSYWLGLRKYVDQYNQEKWMWSSNSTLYNDVSWWPWRRNANAPQQHERASSNAYSISQLNNCVLKRKNEDGYFTTSCDPTNKNSFICQTGTIFPSNLKDSSLSSSELSLQCGNTIEIQKELVKIEHAQIKPQKQQTGNIEKSVIIADESVSSSIGINSINNIVLPTLKPVTAKQATQRINTNNNNVLNDKPQQINEYSKTTVLANKKPILMKNNFASSSSSSILVRQTDSKLNTAVLAGIISGIGLVILIINVGVLFMCRRNLKKFLKSTKEAPREDMIQEYFEAFNTLHNSKTLRGHLASNATSKTDTTILNIPQLHLQQQQLKTNSTCSGTEDSLLHESAQLFYNPPQQQFNREMNIRQSSAFKPFNRDFNENLTNTTGSTLLQPCLNRQSNQYDKMSHQPMMNLKGKNVLVQNDSTGQYAHTYESLDTLDLANRRALVHLGISSRNYRTVLNNTNDSNLLQSPNSTELTEAGNFNLSTSTNLSSTSGTSSSSHQFNSTKPGQLDFMQFQQQMQPLTQAQLVSFNDLIMNKQAGAFNLVNTSGGCGAAGEWSPDSAYYSSIPTLNSYASYGVQQVQSGFTNQQLQQFIANNSSFNCSNSANAKTNNNCNMESFKTHLV